MMWGYHAGVGWGWALGGALMMFAFWGAIIWLAWAALNRWNASAPDRGDARAIADRRLASGQITEQEHQNIVARLKS